MKPTDKKDQAKRKRASNALDFLNSHPAFLFPCSMDFLGNQQVVMLQCCKRGLTSSCVQINRGERGWKKFEKQFEKEDKEYNERTEFIYVDYKRAFGESWKFDHVKYFYDVDVFVFEGDLKSDSLVYNSDCNLYGRHHGFHGSAYTFEDAVIQCANRTKKMFGNFNIENNFFTKKETENHKKHEFFSGDPLDAINAGNLDLAKDPDYMPVSDQDKNVRWAQWFSKTELYKKDYPKFNGKVLKAKWNGKVIP